MKAKLIETHGTQAGSVRVKSADRFRTGIRSSVMGKTEIRLPLGGCASTGAEVRTPGIKRPIVLGVVLFAVLFILAKILWGH
jgi:hypothetical protein